MSQTLLKYALYIVLSTLMVLWWWMSAQDDKITETQALSPVMQVEHIKVSLYDEAGKVQTKVQSPFVSYFNDERGTEFSQPVLHHLRSDGYDELSALTGKQSADRTTIYLNDQVVGKRFLTSKGDTPDSILQTDWLIYDVPTQVAKTDAEIEIDHQTSKTHATGGIWQLNQNLFILKQNIRSRYVFENAAKR